MAKLTRVLTLLLLPIAAGVTLVLRRRPHEGRPPREAERPPKKSPSPASPQPLEALSRAELYDRARLLDIPRRSMMNKQELVEAIRAAAG